MSKILYRPHRGGLKEAMSELKEFKSIKEMLKYVYENESFEDEKSIKDIRIKLYSKTPDNRIGWKNTFVVLSKGRAGCGWFTKDLSKKESLEAYTNFDKEDSNKIINIPKSYRLTLKDVEIGGIYYKLKFVDDSDDYYIDVSKFIVTVKGQQLPINYEHELLSLTPYTYIHYYRIEIEDDLKATDFLRDTVNHKRAEILLDYCSGNSMIDDDSLSCKDNFFAIYKSLDDLKLDYDNFIKEYRDRKYKELIKDSEEQKEKAIKELDDMINSINRVVGKVM